MTNLPKPESNDREAQPFEPQGRRPSQARLLGSRPRSEMADPVLLGRLLSALDGRGVVARRILRDELGVTDDALRAAVRYSRGAVCSLSRRGGGYSLTAQTPTGDAQHSVSELLSRAHQLKMRAAEIVAAINRRGRPQQGGVS